jgi:hypothetical protein
MKKTVENRKDQKQLYLLFLSHDQIQEPARRAHVMAMPVRVDITVRSLGFLPHWVVIMIDHNTTKG